MRCFSWLSPGVLFMAALSIPGVSSADETTLRQAVLDHLGVAAKVGNRVAGIEAPLVGVFAEDIVGAADLAWPVFVIPGAAYGGHVGEPGNFPRGCAQFVEISELPGPAGAVRGRSRPASPGPRSASQLMATGPRPPAGSRTIDGRPRVPSARSARSA